MFGFRPNLSPVAPAARTITDESGNMQFYTPYEVIATDVVLNRGLLNKIVLALHDLGVWNPHFLYFTYDVSRTMAQYIHVALAIGHTAEGMIIDLLRTFHSSRHHWNTNIIDVCRMVSSIPSSFTDIAFYLQYILLLIFIGYLFTCRHSR